MDIYLLTGTDDSTDPIGEFTEQQQARLQLRRFEEGINDIPNQAEVVCFSDDPLLKKVVLEALNRDWCLQIIHRDETSSMSGQLPHHSRLITDIEESKELERDILLCNGEPVLDHIQMNQFIIWDSTVPKEDIVLSIQEAWSNFLVSMKMKPFSLKVKTENSHAMKLSALAIYSLGDIAETQFAEFVDTNQRNCTGMLHLFILSPRSLLGMLRFFIMWPFIRDHQLPPFLGIIRSKSVTINLSNKMNVTIDREESELEELQLSIAEAPLRLRAPADAVEVQRSPANKEIRKLNQIPQEEEAVNEMISKPLPIIAHAATEEFKDLYQQLRDNAKTSNTFIIFMILSSCLATLGLLANSAPVVIGAMLIAPLMDPIISMAMGIVRQDQSLYLPSAKKLTLGVAVGILFSCALTLLVPIDFITNEIRARTNPNVLDLGVAIISGIAGAFATARASATRGLAGVAIAVALVPPLAVTGIGIANLSFSITTGSFLLFLTNLAGIIFSGALTYIVLGFAPFHLAKTGVARSLMLVGLVSLPLIYSFGQLLERSNITEQIKSIDLVDFQIAAVEIINLDDPLTIRAEIIDSDPVTEYDIMIVKNIIQEKLQREIILEVEPVIRL